MARNNSDEVRDFLWTLLRVAMSLGLLTIFVLGEWFLLWLIGLTIIKGVEPQSWVGKVFDWVKQLGALAIAVMWAIHILSEVGLVGLRQLSRR